MNESKNRRESTTLIGAIVTLLSFVVGFVTDKVSPSDVSTIVTSIFTVLGIGMSVYGRTVATKTIK